MLHPTTTFEPLLSCLIMGNFSMKSGHIDKRLKVIFRTAANFYHDSFTFLNSLIFYLFQLPCFRFSLSGYGLKGPLRPETPSWVGRPHGTKSRSHLPSWRRHSGWPGVHAPASRSSGPSTDTPQGLRSHRAERDSAQSAERTQDKVPVNSVLTWNWIIFAGN